MPCDEALCSMRLLISLRFITISWRTCSSSSWIASMSSSANANLAARSARCQVLRECHGCSSSSCTTCTPPSMPRPTARRSAHASRRSARRPPSLRNSSSCLMTCKLGLRRTMRLSTVPAVRRANFSFFCHSQLSSSATHSLLSALAALHSAPATRWRASLVRHEARSFSATFASHGMPSCCSAAPAHCGQAHRRPGGARASASTSAGAVMQAASMRFRSPRAGGGGLSKATGENAPRPASRLACVPGLQSTTAQSATPEPGPAHC
mmetsp:Transcript_13647/g.39511  ORF Transcript_13647/g.39511 Transcript_13647/m.39511 type:complete len:266 (-) Transcript_13647:549-1346(-)